MTLAQSPGDRRLKQNRRPKAGTFIDEHVALRLKAARPAAVASIAGAPFPVCADATPACRRVQ